MKPIIRQILWKGPVKRTWKFAFVSDLHNASYQAILPHLASVDAILITGDLVLRYTNGTDNARAFLKDAPRIAPTYYSLGNHERRLRQAEAWRREIELSGVHLLDNRFVRLGDDLVLGGFSSCYGRKMQPGIVDRMAAQPGVKLLMCHHPEYYPRYVQGKGIDLTLSGHAHGGQVTLFGQGLYAPGQGLFPALTHGFYDDRHLLVSRGLSNTNHLPRIGNPCELILLTLEADT